MSTKPYSWEVEPRDRLVPFGAGDVLWVTSVEYPPSIGSGSGFEFWVQESPLPAPSPGLWFVDGWELAALTRAPVRRRRVCVPAATPRTGWREQPPASDAGAAGGWAGPTRELPIVTRGEWMRRGVVGGDPRPLMTRLAARRTTLVAGGRPRGGRHAARTGTDGASPAVSAAVYPGLRGC